MPSSQEGLKKDQLLSEINQAKEIDEKKEQAQREIEKKKLYDRVRGAAHTGNFEENKTLLANNMGNVGATEIRLLKDFIRSEELIFLKKLFEKHLKKRNFEAAENMLSDIHLRAESSDYEALVFKMEEQEKKKSAWHKLSSFFSSFVKRKESSAKKEIKPEIPTKTNSVLEEKKDRALDQKVLEGALHQAPEKVPEKVSHSASEVKTDSQVQGDQTPPQRGAELELETDKKLSIKERGRAKIEHWKNVLNLIQKEHKEKDKKIDPFALTENVLKRSQNIQEEQASNVVTKELEQKTILPQENVSEFENIFGVSEQDEKDILDTLLKPEKEAIKSPEKSDEKLGSLENISVNDSKGDFQLVDLDEVEEDVNYVNPFLPYIQLSLKLMMFSLFLLVFSFLFFFIQLEPKNTVLHLLGQKNLYTQEKEKVAELNLLNEDIRNAELGLKKLKEGSFNIHAKVALEEVILQKINWIQVREDLHRATLQAFPYNDVLKYIQYNSFTGEATKKNIKISGTVTDPSGRVFLLLTKLVNSINLHPSFSGAEVSTFSKSENGDEEVGGYTTSFSLNLLYKQELEKKDDTIKKK
ncbi:hypothetical protein HON22_05345 [Candidatus Peregrinibacteria bacterium]|nr:hypothetical protein [Candidatus Peregrinibacteria bacterium]